MSFDTNQMIDLATVFEQKYFVMDPDTDTMIPNGWCLEEGMVVLADSHVFRVELTDSKFQDDHDPHSRLKVLKYNRWCMVTNLETYTHSDGTEHTSFIGVYGDGDQRSWDLSMRAAWYVKKDSIPEIDPVVEHEERVANQVKEVIGEAAIQIGKQVMSSNVTSEDSVYHDWVAGQIDLVIDQTTEKILHLF